MSLNARSILAIAAFLWLGLIPGTWAKNCPTERTSVLNRDGSAIQLSVRKCDDSVLRHISAYYQPARGKPLEKVLTLVQRAEEIPMGGATIEDIDRDGIHEIEVRGACGAGPNCEGTIFRLDEDRQRMFDLFHGGYFEVTTIDGYLVESGRTSCCAWEHHVYRPTSPFVRVTDADVVYRVVVGASAMNEGVDTSTCAFYNARDELAQPPEGRLRSLCGVYGKDYLLERPEPSVR